MPRPILPVAGFLFGTLVHFAITGQSLSFQAWRAARDLDGQVETLAALGAYFDDNEGSLHGRIDYAGLEARVEEVISQMRENNQ